jgi:hypothetical protein
MCCGLHDDIPHVLVITVISTRNFRTLLKTFGCGRKYRFIGKQL